MADQHTTASKSTRAAQDALTASTSLASMLRVFVKTTRQSWALTRTQLAHTPSVSSPLSTASALHRRWVSEEIEAETTANTNSTTNLGVPGSFHARNCSDSRIQATGPHGAPLLRKSALSLHRTSQGTLQADAAERAKQVRFQPSLPEDPQVDQARLNELAQLLAQFDAAIELLAVVVQDRQRTNRSDTDSTQTAKGLVTAFVQISRLSSTSGLVKHYDKATLAQFKTTTMAVKRLMAHP
ncbi:hypothetical protein GGH12_002248 [Coemansia sp. RSA 1822]|nr:hypothetical protein GGH12_002248 [Coemansia sp. RSA 1822]